MKQIEIGTCIPGGKTEQWLLPLVDAGFECVSLNFHMTLGGVELKKLAEKIMPLLRERGVRVASLGFYCNPVENPSHKETLAHCIDSAGLFGAPMVSTFAGAYEGEPVEKSIKKFGEVFRDLAARAEQRQIKIAIENCPMSGVWQRATCNIAFHPKAWEWMFQEVPNENVGLEWEPGHQSIQLIDPVAQLREWIGSGRIFHMHGKDCTVDKEAVRRYGVFGAVEFAQQRTPGFGDVDWRQIFSILYAGGYQSDICVEGFHDPVYRGEKELMGQLHALRYLKWCRGGDFIPSPEDPQQA